MNADAKICDGCSANFAEGDNCYGISSIEDSALGGFKPDGGRQLCEGCMENLLEEFKQCHRKCFDSWGGRVMMNINNEFDYEDSETIERIKVSNKLLKKNRLLLGDNDSRIILSEGANTYEYKY